jgi:hypothetical protein
VTSTGENKELGNRNKNIKLMRGHAEFSRSVMLVISLLNPSGLKAGPLLPTIE